MSDVNGDNDALRGGRDVSPWAVMQTISLAALLALLSLVALIPAPAPLRLGDWTELGRLPIEKLAAVILDERYEEWHADAAEALIRRRGPDTGGLMASLIARNDGMARFLFIVELTRRKDARVVPPVLAILRRCIAEGIDLTGKENAVMHDALRLFNVPVPDFGDD